MRTTKAASIAVLSVACLLLFGPVIPARAESGWILALPPLKAPAPPPDADAHQTPAEIVNTLVDRTAPITEWRPGPTFTDGTACEDARLRHVQEFHNAIEAIGDTKLSDTDRAHLTGLAQEAFSRCVPSFAFASNDKH